MPRKEVVIREAKPADLIQLVDIAAQYFEEASRWHGIPFEPTRSVTNALIALDDPNQKIVIAKKEDMIVGMYWAFVSPMIWSSALVCQDRLIYVLPEHRNYTTAKGLLLFVEDWAKRRGAIGFHAGANSGIREDRAAFIFYRRNKFYPVGANFYKELT